MGASAALAPLLPAPSSAATTPPPSVVIILTDDQRWDTLDAMPVVRDELIEEGTTFTNAFVSNPLCCPSRTSILTGRYSHSTGIWRNQPPNGGWASFDDSRTLATQLDAMGYDTGLFGKYLNGYRVGAEEGYVPPGWDRWEAFSRGHYYNYTLSVDGELEQHGDDEDDYSTDLVASRASSFIRSSEGPVFVVYAPVAPHAPMTPAPDYEDDFSDLAPWRPASYNEPDMSDKPAWAQLLPRWGPLKQSKQDAQRIGQYRTLRSVDDAVEELVDALDDTGRLDDTMIVFTSDNGLLWGEHRWNSKMVAYEEAIHVPMVIRYDALGAPVRTERSDRAQHRPGAHDPADRGDLRRHGGREEPPPPHRGHRHDVAPGLPPGTVDEAPVEGALLLRGQDRAVRLRVLRRGGRGALRPGGGPGGAGERGRGHHDDGRAGRAPIAPHGALRPGAAGDGAAGRVGGIGEPYRGAMRSAAHATTPA